MLILAFVFALIIALFAVFNVESVEVNFLFVKTHAPLILVILISTLFGGLTVGALGIFRIFVLQRKLKQYEKNSTIATKDIKDEAQQHSDTSFERMDEETVSDK